MIPKLPLPMFDMNLYRCSSEGGKKPSLSVATADEEREGGAGMREGPALADGGAAVGGGGALRAAYILQVVYRQVTLPLPAADCDRSSRVR